MKASETWKFKKILEGNKRILIFGDYPLYKRASCLGFISAYENVEQPVIIVSKNGYLIDSAMKQTKRLSYRNLKYSLLREVCWSGNPNLILSFQYSPNGISLELELAMLANQMLTDQGYKPLIIIDELSDLNYHGAEDVDVKTFFDEVIRMNIVKDQPVVISSISFHNPAFLNSFLEATKIVISSADYLIALPEIFVNSEFSFAEDAAKEIYDILDKIKNEEAGIRLKSTINEIIEKELPEINETLLFDFNNGFLKVI